MHIITSLLTFKEGMTPSIDIEGEDEDEDEDEDDEEGKLNLVNVYRITHGENAQVKMTPLLQHKGRCRWKQI